MLDEKLLKEFSIEKFKEEYECFRNKKIDVFENNKIKIPMGVDGIDYKNFGKSENLEKNAKYICQRLKRGNYFFHPFREIEVPKPPFQDLKKARRNNKIRILSISSIRDVICQKLIYNVIVDYCEEKFKELKTEVSFGYRKGKSAPMAVRKIHNLISKEEYFFILDADISKFFDDIPHKNLENKLKFFFGIENKILNKYLRRFVSVDKVESKFYVNRKKYKNWITKNDGRERTRIFYNAKPIRKLRKKGIPQGGVLSGLIANIYLHDFDKYVVKKLYAKYNEKIKYFRYADDFIILSKEPEILEKIGIEIEEYLNRQGLKLNHEKTNVLNLDSDNKQSLEFLGFKINSKNISIKNDNIIKFQDKVNSIIQRYKITDKKKNLDKMIENINFKIIGNENFENNNKICKICDKIIVPRSWMSYFGSITDIEILKKLDTWIRKVICKKYYHDTNKRINKKDLIEMKIESLELQYYKYKKIYRKTQKFKNVCKCELNSEFYEEFNYY